MAGYESWQFRVTGLIPVHRGHLSPPQRHLSGQWRVSARSALILSPPIPDIMISSADNRVDCNPRACKSCRDRSIQTIRMGNKILMVLVWAIRDRSQDCVFECVWGGQLAVCTYLHVMLPQMTWRCIYDAGWPSSFLSMLLGQRIRAHMAREINETESSLLMTFALKPTPRLRWARRQAATEGPSACFWSECHGWRFQTNGAIGKSERTSFESPILQRNVLFKRVPLW